MNIRLLRAVLVAVAFMATLSATPIIIDHFTDPFGSGNIDNPGTFPFGPLAATALGNTHTITINRSTLNNGFHTTATIASSIFVFSQDSLVDGSASIVWDNNSLGLRASGNGTTGANGFDLSEGGLELGMRVLVGSDQLANTFTIVLTDWSGNTATFVGSGVANGANPTALFEIPWSGFSLVGPFDITMVKSIAANLNPVQAGDMAFDLLGTYESPEPVACALIGAGLFTIGLLRKLTTR